MSEASSITLIFAFLTISEGKNGNILTTSCPEIVGVPFISTNLCMPIV